MLTRSKEDKDFILSNLEETYFIENFVSKEDIKSLIETWQQAKNKIHKQTGPVTSDIKDHKSPVLDKIKNKIKKLYPNAEIMSGHFFYVNYPHIIHNDDSYRLPLIYKAFNIPLRYEGDELPYLCFFDQVYLDGPSKFFNGENYIKTHHNKIIYDYENVLGKSEERFDPYLKKKYLTHLKDEWLKGLSFNSAHYWQPGNSIVFDCCRLHCASDFRKNVRSKLGLSIFTTFNNEQSGRVSN